MANATRLNEPAAVPSPATPAFLHLLPTILFAARRRFRQIACPNRRADCIGETVALAWAWYCRLTQRGRDPLQFPVAFARLVTRAVASGRRLCGQERVNDILSHACQRRGGFAVTSVPAELIGARPELLDALADNTRSPVPAQVQFRCDFPAWLSQLPAPKQRVLAQLALGHRTSDVASAFGVSSARIAQLRGEFRRRYHAFLSDRRGD